MNNKANTGKKNSGTALGIIITSILMIAAVLIFIKTPVRAAETGLAVKEVNYYDSTVTIQTLNKDTVIYFADSTKKWKAIPGNPDSNGYITMDISWVSDTKNNTLYFKGNISTNTIKITIPKKETRFKASFNKLKGTVVFSNAGVRTIEWRKKGSSTWHTVNTATLATELSYYFTNGAQICFRLAPVNGTGITSSGLRASNEVTVTIPKKTAAPAITVDGSRFRIQVKKGMAYRKLNADGTFTDWINISANTYLMLQDIAPEVLHTTLAGINKSATFQFRYNASSSRQVSNISTVTIPVQKAAPDIGENGIALNYTSSSSLSLTIKAASSSKPFEYTILPKGTELNYQTADWKEISSNSAVSINSKTAPAGSRIYVRLKSVQASDTTEFALASVETDITGANGIDYPPAIQTTQLTTLVSTAGICRTDVSTSHLSFVLYSSTSATVSSIDFYDAYGNKKGSVTCSSTVAKNTGSTGVNDRYIITTKITSTEAVDAFTNESLYAYITLSNQEVIKSTAAAGVILYLYPCTVVNNPSNETGYATAFKRIYMSNDENDDSSFKFKLDFGTEKVADPTGINKFTQEATAIRFIKYSGYTLKKDKDYTVEYGSYVNSDNETVATATVTVNVSVMEKAASIKTTDQELPLIISLNNGETLNNHIFITMICTATIDNTPIAWSVTEGSLKEKNTTTVTNSDGTTSTVTTDVNSYTITLTLFSNTYDVSVSNVTWNGISIFNSATVSQGKATIYLSNAKINKLDTEVTETHNVVITLSNGYVIDSGCKLTIIDAD